MLASSHYHRKEEWSTSPWYCSRHHKNKRSKFQVISPGPCNPVLCVTQWPNPGAIRKSTSGVITPEALPVFPHTPPSTKNQSITSPDRVVPLYQGCQTCSPWAKSSPWKAGMWPASHWLCSSPWLQLCCSFRLPSSCVSHWLRCSSINKGNSNFA